MTSAKAMQPPKVESPANGEVKQPSNEVIQPPSVEGPASGEAMPLLKVESLASGKVNPPPSVESPANGKVMQPARVESLASSGLDAIPAEYVRPEWERDHLGDALDELKKAEDGAQIPIVDLREFDAESSNEKAKFVENVKAAAKEWGVMHIINHGISLELIERVRAVGKGFFDLPIEAKERYANDQSEGKIQGYGSKLANNASGQLEWEDYFFHLIFPADKIDLSIWPKEPAEYT